MGKYVSTPRTPAACLITMVCRGWRATAERVQLATDIQLGLLPEAAAIAPRRVEWVAAWMVKHRVKLRSLRISRAWLSRQPSGSEVWEEPLTSIMQALAAEQQGGAALPYLEQLQLPVLGLPGSAALLDALAGCRSLRYLRLEHLYGQDRFEPVLINQQGLISSNQINKIVATFTQLRVLQLERPRHSPVTRSTSANLLRQLPASLATLDLVDYQGVDSYPLSCVIHLVNLQELPPVRLVVDDISSSSSSGASGLTAVTHLELTQKLSRSDGRLQLPNLHSLSLREAEPAAWRQLQGLKCLRELTVVPTHTGTAAGLALLTQVLELDLQPYCFDSATHPSQLKLWTTSIACLKRLTAVRLPASMVLAGGTALLGALTGLEDLTVACTCPLAKVFYPEGAKGWAATPAGAVVEVVAAATAGGKGQLQGLVLEVPEAEPGRLKQGVGGQGGTQQVGDAARAALPSIAVEIETAAEPLFD